MITAAGPTHMPRIVPTVKLKGPWQMANIR